MYFRRCFPNNGVSIYILNKIESNFDIVNTGMTVTKNIEIFDYKLPVSATAMWNPANKIARIN
jgi:hypothetical protein